VKEDEWTMDTLLGFGRFHHFQILGVQTLVAILGNECTQSAWPLYGMEI
jgi:hypothetical protein